LNLLGLVEPPARDNDADVSRNDFKQGGFAGRMKGSTGSGEKCSRQIQKNWGKKKAAKFGRLTRTKK